MERLDLLTTEQQNPNTLDIDVCSTKDVLTKINNEDQTIAIAVKNQLNNITALVDECVSCLKKGGRIIYVGAGTSGRLGILDASECPPTYGVSDEVVQGVIAGGIPAIFKAQEGAEDSKELAIEDLKQRQLSNNDIVIGLAASGRTPYVIGALEYAKSVGASTGSVCCVANAKISEHANYPVEVVTGPEVVTGSTRMKAGTATKLVLNMISTASMIKMGKVYHNYMVDVQPTNEKLEIRATRMIKQILDIDDSTASKLFVESGKNVKRAIVMHIKGYSCQEASEALEKANGLLADALK